MRKKHQEIQWCRETNSAEGLSQAKGCLTQKREWAIVKGKEKKGGGWLETKQALGSELLQLASLHKASLLQACKAGESGGALVLQDTRKGQSEKQSQW